MSDFEYLNKITIGQYLPIHSWLHQRHPASKLISYFALLCGATLTLHFSGLLIGLGSVLILLVVSNIPLRQALRGLLFPLPFLIILAIIQLLFPPSFQQGKPALDILSLNIYNEGIQAALRLLLRFSVLIILLTVSSATLSDLQFVHGLEALSKLLRLKNNFIGITAQITLRFVPVIAIQAEKIAKAQASRGASWGIRKGNLLKRIYQIIPLLIPLFNHSLKQADTIADAMLARGFDSANKKTSMIAYQMTIEDWLLIILSLLLSTMIIFI